MDYAQEQADELEALSSIFADDLEEVTEGIPSGWSPVGSVWRLVLAPQLDEGMEEGDVPLRVELVFAHTPTYPEEAPLVKARGLQGISDADVGALQSALEVEVHAQLGMAMVYALVSLAQEWVQEKAASMAAPAFDPDAEQRRAREAEEFRLVELRRHGTAVTPETFAAWQQRFEAEQALEQARLDEAAGRAAGAEERRNKLSGKQWFQQLDDQHLEAEEPELEADEEDGEAVREEWRASGGEDDDDEDIDFEDEESDDEEDLLDELLASKAS